MPMTPGVPGATLPDGIDQIPRRIQELERRVSELAAADPLRTAGLVTAPNQLTVQGNLNVTGTENVSGSLNVTGPMTVGGTLSLPAGIIGNAALANPVVPGRAQADEGYPTGFTLTALDVAHAVATITVPTGFTQCNVVAISTARGISNTDWNFGMKTRINGLDGNRTTFGTNTSTNSGGTLSGSCANTETLTGLTGGGTFQVSTVMSVNSGSPAVSVTTVASLLFLR